MLPLSDLYHFGLSDPNVLLAKTQCLEHFPAVVTRLAAADPSHDEGDDQSASITFNNRAPSSPRQTAMIVTLPLILQRWRLIFPRFTGQ